MSLPGVVSWTADRGQVCSREPGGESLTLELVISLRVTQEGVPAVFNRFEDGRKTLTDMIEYFTKRQALEEHYAKDLQKLNSRPNQATEARYRVAMRRSVCALVVWRASVALLALCARHVLSLALSLSPSTPPLIPRPIAFWVGTGRSAPRGRQ